MTRTSFFMYPDNSTYNSNGANSYRLSVTNMFSDFIGFIFYLCHLIKDAITILWWLLTILISLFGYYMMWITLHYAAVHFYPMYCAPLTVTGFVLSPFMVAAPHCVAMRWLITEGSKVIVTMWVSIGAYAIQHMLRRPNNA
jgi:hypothetical protein